MEVLKPSERALLCLAFHLRLRCDISNFNRDGAFGRFRCSVTWRCGIRRVLTEVSTESIASYKVKQFKKNSRKTCYGVYPSSYSDDADGSCFKVKASGA